jgi:hypothetical protein
MCNFIVPKGWKIFKSDKILSNIGLHVKEVQCASLLEVKRLERETVKSRSHQVSKVRICVIFSSPSLGTGATSHSLLLPKINL